MDDEWLLLRFYYGYRSGDDQGILARLDSGTDKKRYASRWAKGPNCIEVDQALKNMNARNILRLPTPFVELGSVSSFSRPIYQAWASEWFVSHHSTPRGRIYLADIEGSALATWFDETLRSLEKCWVADGR